MEYHVLICIRLDTTHGKYKKFTRYPCNTINEYRSCMQTLMHLCIIILCNLQEKACTQHIIKHNHNTTAETDKYTYIQHTYILIRTLT